MKRNLITFLMLGVLCLWQAPSITAAEQGKSAEAQLRDKLRGAMLQLRAAETDRATLQAAQTQWTDEKKALTVRIEEITKQANAYKQAAQPVEGLKTQVSNLEKEIGQLKEAIETSRQATELARKKEAERAKASEDAVAGLERLVGDRQSKNLALYKIACEILQRYEKFGLGDALTAREPFVGITRVKLQNLVQDYQDKLLAERTSLTEKDLVANREKLQNPPHQPGELGAGASKQTSK